MTGRETPAPLRLLVDTNVWIDYFLARDDRCAAATRLISLADASEAVALYVASHTIKDIAYILAATMKEQARRCDGRLTEEVAAAAREVAWGCVRTMLDHVIVVPVGQPEILQAFTYRSVHDDLEDDIILGAAHRAGVDYIVTHDKPLARHSPIPCLDVGQALALAGEWGRGV